MTALHPYHSIRGRGEVETRLVSHETWPGQPVVIERAFHPTAEAAEEYAQEHTGRKRECYVVN